MKGAGDSQGVNLAAVNPNWKDVFKPEVIRSTIHRMLHPEEER